MFKSSTFPNEYTLVGTCDINHEEHTFEYSSNFGKHNGSVIGFLPTRKEPFNENLSW
ncbi:hypothetical protein BVAD3_39800 (plasmid) [Bacillus velezensis]|nr:hypothetical protein BVAD3_39800 [Bacillus velezensis]